MQRIEELPVRAERLVADTRPALDGGRRDGLAELDAAVVADRVGRDRAVTEVRHEGDAPVVAHDRPADLAARVADRAAHRLQLRGAFEPAGGRRPLAHLRT